LQDPADNVSVKIDPLTHRDYKYQIINNHPSGSFWYHAHLHGSTSFQVRHLILCNATVQFHFQTLHTTNMLGRFYKGLCFFPL